MCGHCGVHRLNSGDDRHMDYRISYRDEFEYMQFCSAAMPAISNTGTTIKNNKIPHN